MDPCGDDEIRRLLRLKRYEQPPPDYFENFLHEFRRRQRDELVRQPLWRICFKRVEGFAFRFNIRSLASAGIAVVVACAALISITIYHQPEPVQVAGESSPVPSTRTANADGELHSPPPVFIPPFDTQQAVLPANSRDIRMLPVPRADPLRSDQFVPLRLEP
jgi:hypothetical protein